VKKIVVCPVVGCGKEVKKEFLSLDEVLLADIEQWSKLRSQIAAADSDDDDEPPTQVAATKGGSSKKRARGEDD
jgi:hypothetical protein